MQSQNYKFKASGKAYTGWAMFLFNTLPAYTEQADWRGGIIKISSKYNQQSN